MIFDFRNLHSFHAFTKWCEGSNAVPYGMNYAREVRDFVYGLHLTSSYDSVPNCITVKHYYNNIYYSYSPSQVAYQNILRVMRIDNLNGPYLGICNLNKLYWQDLIGVIFNKLSE